MPGSYLSSLWMLFQPSVLNQPTKSVPPGIALLVMQSLVLSAHVLLQVLIHSRGLVTGMLCKKILGPEGVLRIHCVHSLIDQLAARVVLTPCEVLQVLIQTQWVVTDSCARRWAPARASIFASSGMRLQAPSLEYTG